MMSSRGVTPPVDLDVPLERAQLGHTLRDDCFIDTILTQENREPPPPAPQMSLRPRTPRRAPEALFLASVTFLLCFGLLMLVFRKVVLSTALNQQIAGYMSLVLLSQVVNRAHAWSQGLAAPTPWCANWASLGWWR